MPVRAVRFRHFPHGFDSIMARGCPGVASEGQRVTCSHHDIEQNCSSWRPREIAVRNPLIRLRIAITVRSVRASSSLRERSSQGFCHSPLCPRNPPSRYPAFTNPIISPQSLIAPHFLPAAAVVYQHIDILSRPRRRLRERHPAFHRHSIWLTVHDVALFQVGPRDDSGSGLRSQVRLAYFHSYLGSSPSPSSSINPDVLVFYRLLIQSSPPLHTLP